MAFAEMYTSIIIKTYVRVCDDSRVGCVSECCGFVGELAGLACG